MKRIGIPLCVVTVYALLSGRIVEAQCGLSATAAAGANGNNNTIGTIAWSGTGNTTAQDGSYASAAPMLGNLGTLTTNYLTLNNFGFNIPAANTICGVGLSISRDYSTILSLEGYATDNIVQLATINSAASLTLLGSNQAVTGAAGAWNSGAIATTAYGGSGNMMGAALAPADVNNSNFGVAISAKLVSLVSLVIQANIDKVSISIYSTPILLPVKLDNFNVTADAAGNTLRWITGTTETTGSTGATRPAANATEFVVQRSADGTSWEDLATLDALPAVEIYSYTDAYPLAGPNYYRLEILNAAGISGYSITAIISSQRPAGSANGAPGAATGPDAPGIHCYPNPFHDMINIGNASRPLGQVRLSDVTGRTLRVEECPGGAGSLQVTAADLPPGMYFLTVDGTTYKLIKE